MQNNQNKRLSFMKSMAKLLSLVVVVVLIVFCIGTNRDAKPKILQETKISIPMAPDNFYRLQMEPEKIYRQPIKVIGNVLMNIHFPVSEIDANSEGLLAASLVKRDGSVIDSLQLDYQTLLSGAGTLNNIDYFLLFANMSEKVSKNEEIYLELILTDCVGKPLSICCYQNYTEKNLDALHIDGQKSNHKLFLEYQYYSWIREPHAEKPYVWMLVVLLCGTVFLPSLPAKLTKLCLSIIPVGTLLAFEIISGNLRTLEFKYIVYTLLLLYALYITILTLIGKKVGAIIFVACCNILSIVNYFVYQFRDRAFTIADFASAKTAAAVADNYQYIIPYSYLLSTLAMMCLGVLILRGDLSDRRTKKPIKHFKIKKICIPVMLWILVGIVLPSDDYFKLNDAVNYETKGWFFTSYVKFFISSELTIPKNYSEELAAAAVENATYEYTHENVKPQNMIIIMNEAFSDLSVVTDLEFNQPVMPFWNSLSDDPNTEKGYLSVPVWGGNTCNTEWEFLSGSSKYLGNIFIEPFSHYYQSDKALVNTEGIVSDARNLGFRTVALHPHNAANWNRKVVYPSLGFDEFYDFASYIGAPDTEFVRDYISDKCDYLKIIAEHEKYENDNLFVFNVTMQNHGGYIIKADQVEKTVWLADEPDQSDSALYFSLLRKSDEALEMLIDYFRNCDERTMIVIFGDHQPSIENEFFKRVYGSNTDIPSVELEKKYITPYMIWTNYDRVIGNRVPFMSTNYLAAHVKRAADWNLSKYEAYLLTAMEKYPVIGKFGVCDSDYNYTLYEDCSKDQSEFLDSIRFAQYYHLTQNIVN